MNELMNKVMAFRSQVDHVWKTPNTLDCLRCAAKSANELRDLLMRRQNPDHARHNERDDSMAQELADTVIMLLTAASDRVVLPTRHRCIVEMDDIDDVNLYDTLCLRVEACIPAYCGGKSYGDFSWRAVFMCVKIAHHLNLTLDDIVKARLKDIAKRNGFDVGIVDEVWNGDE